MARAACIAALLVAAAFAQAPLRTTSHLIVAPTTVVDHQGKYVDGLTADDFQILDNGQPRKLNLDLAYSPISLVVVVQADQNSAAAVNKLRKVASVIETLVTGERGQIALIAFDSEPHVVLNFTSDPEVLDKSFRELRLRGNGAHMVDAVDVAVRMLAERSSVRRRVILLFGESRDHGSSTSLDRVISQAQQENVTIYAAKFSTTWTAFTAKPGTLPPPGGLNLLAVFSQIGRMTTARTTEAFATYTGGRVIAFNRQDSLEDAIAHIGEELHSQYMLSFQAGSEPDDVYHEIEIKVPAHPEYRLRTRPGYWMKTPE